MSTDMAVPMPFSETTADSIPEIKRKRRFKRHSFSKKLSGAIVILNIVTLFSFLALLMIKDPQGKIDLTIPIWAGSVFPVLVFFPTVIKLLSSASHQKWFWHLLAIILSLSWWIGILIVKSLGLGA